MAHVLASLLRDFDRDERRTPPTAPKTSTQGRPKDTGPSPQEKALRELEERVRAEERSIAQKRLADAVDAERARAEDALAAERRTLADRYGDALHAHLADELAQLEIRISESVAHVLAPVLEEGYRRKAVEEFVAAARTLLRDPAGQTVRLSGPDDLLSCIAARLGPEGRQVEYVPSESVDLRLTAGETSIETQLAAWAGAVSDALRAS